MYILTHLFTFLHYWIPNWTTKCTAETDMKYFNFRGTSILGVLQFSNRGEIIEHCGLCLSILLDMWNIAGHVLGSYTDQSIE